MWPTEAGAVFAFLTTGSELIVAAIQPKTMPVLLDEEDEERFQLERPRKPAADHANAQLPIGRPFSARPSCWNLIQSRADQYRVEGTRPRSERRRNAGAVPKDYPAELLNRRVPKCESAAGATDSPTTPPASRMSTCQMADISLKIENRPKTKGRCRMT